MKVLLYWQIAGRTYNLQSSCNTLSFLKIIFPIVTLTNPGSIFWKKYRFVFCSLNLNWTVCFNLIHSGYRSWHGTKTAIAVYIDVPEWIHWQQWAGASWHRTTNPSQSGPWVDDDSLPMVRKLIILNATRKFLLYFTIGWTTTPDTGSFPLGIKLQVVSHYKDWCTLDPFHISDKS